MLAQPPAPARDRTRDVYLAAAGVCALLLVAYLPVWAELADAWLNNPQDSHGVLVVPFSLYLLWHRRGLLPAGGLRPTWWAVPVLLLAGAVRYLGSRYYVGTLEQYSLFPAAAGLVLAFAGWAGLRWAWPSVAFLFFAIPLHGRVSGLVTGPLQTVATAASTFLLQAAGVPAVSSGNVIHLTEVDVGVVEACNGLRMMMTFFALATAVAVVVDRPWWQRAVIAAAAVPISVGCNIARIAATGVLHETVGHELADRVFHDLAGWLMMPAALAALWIGLRVLDLVFVPVRAPDPGPGARSVAGPPDAPNPLPRPATG